MKPEINWIQIPSGYATIGSNEEDMKKASEFWKDKLLNPTYGREKNFKNGCTKNFHPISRISMNFSFQIRLSPMNGIKAIVMKQANHTRRA